MENKNCPICGQNNIEIIFEKGNLDEDLINVICKNCGLVYLNPAPSKEEYDEFHKEKFLSEKSILSAEQIKAKLNASNLKIKRSVFDFLNEYLKEGQNILDIGCGFGTLLDIIKNEKHANVCGVELGRLDIQAAKENYGLDLFCGSLEDFAENQENWGKFDVVIMHHTLEHLPEPLRSLGWIKKLLKPEGILYVGVPNLMNLKKRPEIFFQIAHPISFSPYSLKLMLEKAGFGIIKFNKNAGYPGGMETAARIGAASPAAGLDEGQDFQKAISYIGKINKKFSVLRKSRDFALFFLPKPARIKLGGFFYRIMKRGTDDRQFFKLAVLPSSVIAGLLFNLQYVFAFIKTLIAGNAFNLFTFANPDALIFYFPLVRAAYDGGSRIVDGRILENFFLPNLWTQLSPILIAPLWRLAGSPSFAWMLGVFIMAVGAFICFYFLCRQIIGHRIFSLLYSFIFISVTLVFNYLFPTSLENLKLAGRVILPFGSPAADVLLSKYISFSVLPGFLLFVASFLLILMALIRKRKIFIILAGFCAGILPYIQITFFVYVFAVLFCALLLFLLYKEYISAKRIIWICVVAGLASAFYWFNFLQIKMLPWTDEFYKRLGGEITHQFRWSHWSEYLAYAIMGWLVLRWGNKTRKRAEAIFVAGAVLAALGVTNMQVVTGFNPIFSVWSNHNIFLGFALGWLVLIYWIYTGLSKKFDKRIVGAAFLVLFLMTMGKFIYMAYCVGNNFSKYDLMPKGIYAPLEWLSANTERDSVVATPSLTTNALLPFYTHNNSMLPLAFTSPMSLEDVRDRYFVAYKFFNVSADYFKKALEGKLSAAGSIGFENNLWGFLIADYYCDHSLGAFEKPGACFTADSSAAIEKTAGDYAAYPSRREYLLNKYRIDYIFYGPDEKIMGKPDFTGFEKVYDKDGYEIYKRGVM